MSAITIKQACCEVCGWVPLAGESASSCSGCRALAGTLVPVYTIRYPGKDAGVVVSEEAAWDVIDMMPHVNIITDDASNVTIYQCYPAGGGSPFSIIEEYR